MPYKQMLDYRMRGRVYSIESGGKKHFCFFVVVGRDEDFNKCQTIHCPLIFETEREAYEDMTQLCKKLGESVSRGAGGEPGKLFHYGTLKPFEG